MSSASPSPPRQSFRSRMGTLMRRPSAGFPTPSLKRSESKTSLSDVVKEATKASSLKLGTTLTPPSIQDHPVVSPVVESPAREAAASDPPPVGPSSLATEIFAQSEPENPPASEPVPTGPPAETPFAAETITAEPDELSPYEVVASNPPATVAPPSEPDSQSPDKDFGIPRFQPIITPEPDRTARDDPPPQATAAVEELRTSIRVGSETESRPHTPPNMPVARGRSVTAKASFGGRSVAESLAESVASSRPGQVSAKPSKSSIASSYQWSARADPNQGRYTTTSRSNGDGRPGSSVRGSIDDPFVDPPAKHTVLSPVDSVQIPVGSVQIPVDSFQIPVDSVQIPEPEPADASRQPPKQFIYDNAPNTSMPLPARYDVIASQSVHTTPSIYTMASRKQAIAADTDETRPLIQRYPMPEPSTKASDPGALDYPPHNPWGGAGTPMQMLGWNHITLPDNTVYFVHSGMRVTTDVDLRISKKREAVTAYLQHSHPAEGVVPPEGWEMWLVDAGTTRSGITPVKSWVNHTEKILSFDPPPRLQLENGSAHQVETGVDDGLDSEYRYWAFMESHPAHAPLPRNARADALDALTWSYTDCLLPSGRPIPPPFAQDECQELMKLLRSLGSPEDSNSQQVVHTRIVSRILMRLAQWRQHYFRPNKPLPKDPSRNGPRRERRTPFRKSVQNFIISTICLGLPYLFLDRAHPLRIVDEESGMRGAGPMLAIGACSCLVAAIILSASVTLITLPGLDNMGRIAGFVAILCSTASMISAVMALFRYKADVERTVVYIGGEGLVMLSRRSIVMSLPLVFLAWSIAAFITAITLYSFRGFTVTSPGIVKQHFDEFTHWIVVGVTGVLAGVLITSALLLRRP